MKQQYRLIAGFLLTAFIGTVLGVMVQIGSWASDGWYGGDPVAAFGLVSYGLFFWITICTLRAYYSRCGLHASLLVLCLLIPAICSYGLSAWIIGNPLNSSVMQFGMMMLLPSAAAAWFLRATHRYTLSRFAVRGIGTLALFFDLVTRIRCNPLAVLTAAAVYVWFLYITRDLNAEKRRFAAAERAYCQ